MVALAAALCLASGFALVSLGWSRRFPLGLDLLFRGALSIGFGLGVFSVVLFLCRVAGITNLMAADLLVFAMLVAALRLRTHRASATAPPASACERAEAWPFWFQRVVTASFAISLFAAVYAALRQAVAHPHGGGWDAFAIWNLHARFLAGPHWRDGFSPRIPWSHPDYPLLLPASVANFWTCLGGDNTAVPEIIGLAFTFTTVGILFAALRILRGRVSAMLGAMTLLATPAFVELGTWQYADVPLSFFLLGAVALLCLHDENSQPATAASSGLLLLAGVAAGFGAWTKNEGVLFLCALIVARQLAFRPIGRKNSATARNISFVRHSAPLLLGIAPLFLLIIYFKHRIAPPGDLFSDAKTMLGKLLQPARYWAVLKAYGKEFLRFGGWLAIPGTLLLAVLYFVAGRGDRHGLNPGSRGSALALILTVGGYFVIYLITPYEIYWHLRFSLGRLFLQLWPSTIFLFFLWLGSDNTLPDSK